MINRKCFILFFTCIAVLGTISATLFMFSERCSELVKFHIEKTIPDLKINSCKIKTPWTISLSNLLIKKENYFIKIKQATISLNLLYFLIGRANCKYLHLQEPSFLININNSNKISSTTNHIDFFKNIKEICVENGSFLIIHESEKEEYYCSIQECSFSFSSKKERSNHFRATVTFESTCINDIFSFQVKGEDVFEKEGKSYFSGSILETSQKRFCGNIFPITWKYFSKEHTKCPQKVLQIEKNNSTLLKVCWIYKETKYGHQFSSLDIQAPFFSIKGNLELIKEHWNEGSVLSIYPDPKIFLSNRIKCSKLDFAIHGYWKCPNIILLNEKEDQLINRQNNEIDSKKHIAKWSYENDSSTKKCLRYIQEFMQVDVVRAINAELEWSFEREKNLYRLKWNVYGDVPWKKHSNIWIESTGDICVKVDDGIYLDKIESKGCIRPNIHTLPNVNYSFLGSFIPFNEQKFSYEMIVNFGECDGKYFDLNQAQCNFKGSSEENFISVSFDGYAKGSFINGNLNAQILDITHKRIGLLIKSITGKIDNSIVKLIKPFLCTFQVDLLEISNIEMNIGTGLLQAQIKQNIDHFNGFISLYEMPFSIINLFLNTHEPGNCTGRISANISESEKIIKLHLYVKRCVDAHKQSPHSFRLEAKIDNNLLESSLIWDDKEQSPNFIEGIIPIEIQNKYPYITYSAKSSLLLDSNVKIPIAWIKQHLPTKEISLLEGLLAFKGRITGPQFSIIGEIELIDVSFALDKKIILVLSDVNGKLLCQGETIEWSNLFGKTKSEGKLYSKGKLSWKEGLCATMSLDLLKTSFSYLGTIDIQGSGRLDISLSNPISSIDGTLEIDKAYMSLFQIANPPKSILRPKSLNVDNEDFCIDLNIRLNSTGNFFVYGEEIMSEWEGILHLSGTNICPLFHGSFNAIYGTLGIGERYFSIINGNIEFKGELLKSRIRIMAELLIDKYRISAILDGTLSNPEISLTAKPQKLSTKKIVKLLLFGTIENNDTIDLLQAIQKAKTPFGNEKSIQDLIYKLKRSIQIDHLGILTSPYRNKRMYALQIAKHFRRNIFFIIQKELTSSEGHIGVDLKLSPYLSVRTEACVPKAGSFHLLWRLNY